MATVCGHDEGGRRLIDRYLTDLAIKKALAIAGKTRHPMMPTVPTTAEAGLPDFTLEAWVGLFAPAGTPKRIIERFGALYREAWWAKRRDEGVQREDDLPRRYLPAAGLALAGPPVRRPTCRRSSSWGQRRGRIAAR